MDDSAQSGLKDPGRRTLLKFGVAGAVVLAMVPLFVRRGQKPVAKGYQNLRQADLDLWRALTPAMLLGSLPADPAVREPLMAEILLRIDGAISLLRAPLRKATMDMLDFVEMAPAHGLSGGFWGDWREASLDDATRVLESWSTSRLTMLRACYRSLHDFVMGSWYAMPQSWGVVGYPGPPQLPKIPGVNA